MYFQYCNETKWYQSFIFVTHLPFRSRNFCEEQQLRQCHHKRRLYVSESSCHMSKHNMSLQRSVFRPQSSEDNTSTERSHIPPSGKRNIILISSAWEGICDRSMSQFFSSFLFFGVCPSPVTLGKTRISIHFYEEIPFSTFTIHWFTGRSQLFWTDMPSFIKLLNHSIIPSFQNFLTCRFNLPSIIPLLTCICWTGHFWQFVLLESSDDHSCTCLSWRCMLELDVAQPSSNGTGQGAPRGLGGIKVWRKCLVILKDCHEK